MKNIWLKQTSRQKRIVVGLVTFVIAVMSISLMRHNILFPGIFFASFALPAVGLLSESITHNMGNTGAVMYASILCGLCAASFAAPIKSYTLRILRNIAIAPLIIFGLILGMMALSGAGFIGPA